jgi:hypothetical protein
MNFFRGDGTGMTVEGFSPNAPEDIQNDRNNTARRMGFFVFMIFEVLANQADFPAVTVLLLFGFDSHHPLHFHSIFGKTYWNFTEG